MEQSDSSTLANVNDDDDTAGHVGSAVQTGRCSARAADSLILGEDGSTPEDEPNTGTLAESSMDGVERGAGEAGKIGSDEMEETDEPMETENICHKGGITGIPVGDDAKGEDTVKDAQIDEGMREKKTENLAEIHENVDIGEQGEAADVVIKCLYGDCPMNFTSNEEVEKHLVSVHMWQEVADGPNISPELNTAATVRMCEGTGKIGDDGQPLPGGGVTRETTSMEKETVEATGGEIPQKSTGGEIPQKMDETTPEKRHELNMSAEKEPSVDTETENIEEYVTKSSEMPDEILEKSSADIENRTDAEVHERRSSVPIKFSEQDCQKGELIDDAGKAFSETNDVVLEKGIKVVVEMKAIESHDQKLLAEVEKKLAERESGGAGWIKDIGKMDSEKNDEVCEKDSKVMEEWVEGKSHHDKTSAGIEIEFTEERAEARQTKGNVGETNLETDSKGLEEKAESGCHEQKSSAERDSEFTEGSGEVLMAVRDVGQTSLEEEEEDEEVSVETSTVAEESTETMKKSETLIGKDKKELPQKATTMVEDKVAEESCKFKKTDDGKIEMTGECREPYSSNSQEMAICEPEHEEAQMVVGAISKTSGRDEEKLQKPTSVTKDMNMEGSCKTADTIDMEDESGRAAEIVGSTREITGKIDSKMDDIDKSQTSDVMETDLMCEGDEIEAGMIGEDGSDISVKEKASDSSMKDDVHDNDPHVTMVTGDGQELLEDNKSKETRMKRKWEGQIDKKDESVDEDDSMEVNEGDDGMVGDQLQMLLEDVEEDDDGGKSPTSATICQDIKGKEKQDCDISFTDVHHKQHGHSSSTGSDVQMDEDGDVIRDSSTGVHRVIVQAEKSDKEVDKSVETRSISHRGEITDTRLGDEIKGKDNAQTEDIEERTEKVKMNLDKREISQVSAGIKDGEEAASNKTITCTYENCSVNFTTKKDAEEHFVKVHKEKDVKISEKGETNTVKEFNPESKLQGYNDDVKSGECDKEGESDTVEESSPENKLPCPVKECSLRFANMDAMLKHHAKDHKKITCRYCQQVFSSFRIYIAHEAHHLDYLSRITFDEGTKTFKPGQVESMLCDSCGTLLDSVQAMLCHMHEQHQSVYKEQCYQCMWCPKAFNCKSDIELHATKVLNQFLNSCDTCKKDFYSLAELDKHLEDSHQSTEFLCAHCKLCFHTENMRNLHQNVMHKVGKETPVHVEKAPLEKPSVENAPVEKTPMEKLRLSVTSLGEKASIEMTPVEKASIEMTPVEKAPVESALGEKAPIEKGPVEKGHVEEAPVEKAPR
ncbi:uncharacterized protein [Amphiura filiformis]|uniref:uncharacterized protein n=1 Tax=Amphiura filiformis TaxID=82378 RepID=UPI003B20FA3A